MKHGILLKEALTHEPLNAIFVMIEYHDREEAMLEYYDNITAPIN
jgi:hypothetical protein